MSKTSIYRKTDYQLSFGEDVVFLDIEVKITRTGHERQSFEMEILKAQLAQKDMEFAKWLVGLLSTEGLQAFNSNILNLLKAELTPSLFTLFYSSDLQPDES